MPQEYELITHTVLAMQLTPASVSDAELWTGGLQRESVDPFDSKKTFVELNIPTLDGVKRASQGDWIFKKDGSFQVMSDREFRSTYRPIRS